MIVCFQTWSTHNCIKIFIISGNLFLDTTTCNSRSHRKRAEIGRVDNQIGETRSLEEQLTDSGSRQHRVGTAFVISRWVDLASPTSNYRNRAVIFNFTQSAFQLWPVIFLVFLSNHIWERTMFYYSIPISSCILQALKACWRKRKIQNSLYPAKKTYSDYWTKLPLG